MKVAGIIFDLNGVLWEDSQIQKNAWKTMSESLRGYPFTNQEIIYKVYGRSSQDTINYLLTTLPKKKESRINLKKKRYSIYKKYSIEYILDENRIEDQHLQILIHEKEEIYRKLCSDLGSGFKMRDKTVEFLDRIKKERIPRTIATASQKQNLSFFINNLGLDTWFDTSKIIYNDGTFEGKPKPTIYIKASNSINVPLKSCLVIEDAISGIYSAISANIGIVCVYNCSQQLDEFEGKKEVIKIDSLLDVLKFI